ncbi:hypothetical protein DQ04_01701090 [Trypanosoma grayi]|uniref:hypothetical protein n=1 Tax=Trypanosoma grayi TaxID=71804 RepID=UPI0004F44821|nr:hypothetical protein DQ04_01701090 [Trypanosoma grayi]KEG12458.1 hypothetical protein DQ04_01701090 [Trypanosoma grayi]
MSSKHRDPGSSTSLHCSTPRTAARGSKTESSTNAAARVSQPECTTPRRSGGSGSSLIVARGLYEVLEQELRDQSSPRKRAHSRGTGQASRPNFLFCYLCGLQFSSASLPIHQPQCYVKKLIEWERMDPAKRGPKPLDPESHEKQMKELCAVKTGKDNVRGGKMRGRDLDRFNEMQIDHFNTNMLLKCENCGRTFLPDRLEVHQRSCKPGSSGASKPISRPSSSATAKRQPSQPTPQTPTEGHAAVKTAEVVSLDKKPGQALTAVSGSETPCAVSASSSPHKTLSRQESLESPASMEKDPLASTKPAKDAAPSVAAAIAAITASSDDVGDNNDENDIDRTSDAEICAAVSPKRSGLEHTQLEVSAPTSRQVSQGATASLSGPRKSGVKSVDLPAVMVEEKRASMCLDEKIPSDGASRSRDTQSQDEEPLPERRGVKIPLNNVSRFKNVQSRLKLDLPKKEELPRCRHCNRTFNVDRLAKHEEVCLERNKPLRKPSTSAGRASSARASGSGAKKGSEIQLPIEVPLGTGARKKQQQQQQQPEVTASPPKSPQALAPDAAAVPATATVTTTTETTKAAAAADPPSTLTTVAAAPKNGHNPPTQPKEMGGANSDGVSEAPKLRYCFECGTKLHSGTQRFCAECGTKLLA